jgi:hypothetical protein
MPSRIIAIGSQFGRLTVTGPKYRGEGKSRNRYYIPVRCACGTEKTVNAVDMTGGKIVSCGCLFKEVHSKRCTERNHLHGKSHTPEHVSWLHMWQRCTDPTHKSYVFYGARGVQVHETFKSFVEFYKEIGPRPENTTLDRIDSTNISFVSMRLRLARSLWI